MEKASTTAVANHVAYSSFKVNFVAIELHSRIMRGDADRRAHVREIKRLTQDLAKRDSEKETLSVEVQEASERVSRLEQENEALGIECFRQFGKLDRRCKVSRLPLRGKKISMSLVKEQSREEYVLGLIN
uniref:Uncharacterized protein LOC104234845 n=1 Tax=Nicotiana sylvestris TaxID=4096 RepID=A0A1U7XIJ9_NICSY|nr:PREDICTED: uncharacterized protein LOC104234845 [Nicotiana sylvestris]